LSEFAYRQPTFAVDDVAGMTQSLHEEGYALVPGVLNAEEVANMRAAVDRLEPFGFDHRSALQEHYKCVFNRERIFLDLADREGIVDLAEKTMGDQCHIIGMTAWRSHPGYNGWGNHADEIMVPVPEPTLAQPNYHLPILICTAHYYLNDIPTEDYCPTYVIPGSHKSGRRPDKGEEEWEGRGLEPVLVKAGDVLFFRSEVWHSGSANRSEAPRYLVQVHYSHRFISQKFTPWPWQYNPEILAVANDRQLRLLGKHPESNYG
jgi:ectoine hydroxylase-related dioxygenase (phytanoyl-CoA dioxygenase family)